MKLFLVFGLMMGIGINALAGDKPGDKPGTSPAGNKAISWAELKERCANPRSFPDVQREPENIKIQCSDNQVNWVASAPGEFALQGARNVMTGLFSDKFVVNMDTTTQAAAARTGTCHRFKEIQEAFTVERQLSCAEVLGVKSDLAEYCTSILDQSKGSNPKLIEAKDTGRTIDTCSAVAIIEAGKPGAAK